MSYILSTLTLLSICEDLVPQLLSTQIFYKERQDISPTYLQPDVFYFETLNYHHYLC